MILCERDKKVKCAACSIELGSCVIGPAVVVLSPAEVKGQLAFRANSMQ